MADKYDLKKMLEEIQEDEKHVRSATRHLSQDDIKKMMAAKRKTRKADSGDGDQKKD